MIKLSVGKNDFKNEIHMHYSHYDYVLSNDISAAFGCAKYSHPLG